MYIEGPKVKARLTFGGICRNMSEGRAAGEVGGREGPPEDRLGGLWTRVQSLAVCSA